MGRGRGRGEPALKRIPFRSPTQKNEIHKLQSIQSIQSRQLLFYGKNLNSNTLSVSLQAPHPSKPSTHLHTPAHTTKHKKMEDIKSTAIEMFLQMSDIVEKTNKFHTEDIDKFAASAVSAKRINPLVKKIYDLETLIMKFRSDVRRVVLSAAAAPASAAATAEAAEVEDPQPSAAPEVKEPKKTGGGAGAGAGAGAAAAAATEVAPVVKKGKNKKEEPAAAAAAAAAPAPSPAAAPAATDADATKPKRGRPKKPATAAAAAEAEDSSTEEEEAAAAETEADTKAPLHVRRKKIPKAIRMHVWNLHIGSHKGEDRCMCCKEKKIDLSNFHCGHVIAESKGGDLTIKNLRPICAACNSAMGTRSMNEFTREFFGWEV